MKTAARNLGKSLGMLAALIGAAGATLAWTHDASAQETLGGYALDQLDPAPAGDDLYGVSSATVNGHLEFRAYLMFDYAFDPLVVGDGDKLVSGQGFLRADASFALFNHLLLSLDVPVALVQSGDSPVVSGVTLQSPDGPGMGDLRLGIRGNLFGGYRDPFAIALASSFFFPTAGSDNFAGEGAPRVKPELSLGGRYGAAHTFFWDGNLGVMMRGPDNPHTITYGVGMGVGIADDLVQIGAELFGATQLESKSPLTTPRVTVAQPTTTSMEFLGSAKLRVVDGLVFGAAAGPGVLEGIGTPTARIIGKIGWEPVPDRDRGDEDDDLDGVSNRTDACPDEKGVADEDDPNRNGCVPPDKDGDRVPDALDACPSLAGRSSGDPSVNGCPTDFDKDGVADSEDACPNQKGVSSIDPKRNGCPGEVDTDLDGIADRSDACPKIKGSINADPAKNGCPTKDGDGDGIADVEDACPNERGPANTDKTLNGCPKGVRVTTAEIVILRQVRFKLAKASVDQTVDPVSDDLLTEVRDVILQHPEIETIEVQGHADDSGTAEFNKQLSQQRAESIKTWLIKRGVDGKRLIARGYGSTRPLATNQSEDGRAQNRRVQFVIIKKK